MQAVERRAPVIYQAAMFDGRFVGFADFLVFDGERYRLRDTKLARSVKVEALLQLAAYADTLAARGSAGGRQRSSWFSATAQSPATGSTSCCRSTGPRRAALQRLLDDHFAQR